MKPLSKRAMLAGAASALITVAWVAARALPRPGAASSGADSIAVRRVGDSAPERSRPEAACPDQPAPARRAGDSAPERSRPEAARPDQQAPVVELAARQRDLEFYRARVEHDPGSAADLAALAGLYLQRARDGGGVSDYRLAEHAARRSLAIREARNGRSLLNLASALLAQHRFPEALAAAQRLVAADPESPSYRALLGELQLELGHYHAADSTFSTLRRHVANLAVAPRAARWVELNGNTEQARLILYAARDSALHRPDLPREQVAWFHLRIADLELRAGRVREARDALREGLALRPADPRLLSLMARAEAARGRLRQAIRYGEQAGDRADIATLALLGDAHAALGHHQTAERYFEAVEAAASSNPEPFNRQWTQFRLDHGRHTAETLAILVREAGRRGDVLGYDMLAWALFQAGRLQDARDASKQALRLGTRDASFHFHAGIIERALGFEAEARAHLRRALDINPHVFQLLPGSVQGIVAAKSGAWRAGRSGTSVLRMRDGRRVEDWVVNDQLSMLQQLGLVQLGSPQAMPVAAR